MLVRCTFNYSAFLVGKVYDFTNGVVDEGGCTFQRKISDKYELKWWNKNKSSQFEEVEETIAPDLNIHIKALRDYCFGRNCDYCVIGRIRGDICNLRDRVPSNWQLLQEKTPKQLKIEELEKDKAEYDKKFEAKIRELKEV